MAANDERSIGATPITHISCAAVRSINQVTELNDPAGGVRPAVKSCRPGAPPSGNRRFQAKLIAGRGTESHQIGIAHAGFETLPDAEPHAVDHRGAGLETTDFVLILDHARFQNEVARIDYVFYSGVDQCLARVAVKTAETQFFAEQTAFFELGFDFPGECLRFRRAGLRTRRAGQPGASRTPLFDPRALVGHLVIVAVMLVHHRIVFGEEQHVAAHRVGEALEPGEIADVVMIGFENRSDAVLAHHRLRALDAQPAHALGVKPLLPIRCFRTVSKLRCVLNHDRLLLVGTVLRP